MNRVTTLCALGTLVLASGTALAAAPAAGDASAYWGVSVGQVNYAESGLPHFKPTAFLASLGWEFSRNLAVEARVGAGIGSDSAGTPVDVKVKSFYGGYLRGTLPVSDAFSVYALAGYGHGELEASAMGASASTSDGSFSGGVGGEFRLGRSGAVGLEYGRMVSGSGYDADLISIGYRMRF